MSFKGEIGGFRVCENAWHAIFLSFKGAHAAKRFGIAALESRETYRSPYASVNWRKTHVNARKKKRVETDIKAKTTAFSRENVRG